MLLRNSTDLGHISMIFPKSITEICLAFEVGLADDANVLLVGSNGQGARENS